jgi:hypothetical protein
MSVEKMQGKAVLAPIVINHGTTYHQYMGMKRLLSLLSP